MGVVAASLSKAVERDTAPKMIDPRQSVSESRGGVNFPPLNGETSSPQYGFCGLRWRLADRVTNF